MVNNYTNGFVITDRRTFRGGGAPNIDIDQKHSIRSSLENSSILATQWYANLDLVLALQSGFAKIAGMSTRLCPTELPLV